MVSVYNLSKFCLCALFVLQMVMDNSVNAKTLALTSLEWPPFAGQSLPEQGASIFIVRKALESMGHELQVDFYPWNRAVRLAKKKGNKYIGYFPEYEYQTTEFVFSNVIGTSPLGIIENVNHPIEWHEEKDLNQYTLGVVDGYVNTFTLDTMIENGQQKAESVTSDMLNIRKLAVKRIDAAVIDLIVFKYLLHQTNRVKMKTMVKINPQILEIKNLYVAFNATPEGEFWREMLDQGLNKIDIEQLFEQYTARHFDKVFD
jgi:polar amino acid transport system substrate-binding protein